MLLMIVSVDARLNLLFLLIFLCTRNFLLRFDKFCALSSTRQFFVLNVSCIVK